MIELAVIAGLLAVALVAVVYLGADHLRRSEHAWFEERRELLNRIQRPEMLPQSVSAVVPLPEPEPDEIRLVGTMHFDPSLSLDEYDGFGEPS